MNRAGTTNHAQRPSLKAIAARLTSFCAWLVVAGAAGGLVVAFTGIHVHRWAIAAAAIGPLWAAPNLLGALVGTSWARRSAAALLALGWFAVAGGAALDASFARGDGSVAVAAVNLYAANPVAGDVVATALGLDADILITSETTDETRALIVASGRYRRAVHGAGDAADVTIWTSMPLLGSGRVDAGTKTFPTVTVDFGGASVTVVGVHTTAPVVTGGISAWEEELAALKTWAGRRDDIVLAGDFNATTVMAPMRELGLVDTAAARWSLFERTWPAAMPLIGIDHVLVGDLLRVGDHRTFALPGSDHRGVLGELGLAAS